MDVRAIFSNIQKRLRSKQEDQPSILPEASAPTHLYPPLEAEEIRDLYCLFFGEDVDEDAVLYFENQVNCERPAHDLIREFLSAPAVQENLKAHRDGKKADSSLSFKTEDIRDLYCLLFGDDVDEGAIRFFENQVRSGRPAHELIFELLNAPAVQENLNTVRAPQDHSNRAVLLKELHESLLGERLEEADVNFRMERLEKKDGIERHLETILQDPRYKSRANSMQNLFVEPGHFYSPIVDVPTVWKDTLSTRNQTEVAGVKIDNSAMLALWDRLLPDMKSANLPEHRQEGRRYFTENGAFMRGDGLIYSGLLRMLKPARIIEVGSGFSSALLLDVVDEYFEERPQLTFIDPYPATIYSLLSSEDRQQTEILPKQVQEVDLERFKELEAGDLLFIDSTHILKTMSDVYWELFHILPSLKPGVIVHFHDIFWPFEYPESWIFDDKRSWNEAYALHAFLMYQERFEIMFFNDYFAIHNTQQIRSDLPDFLNIPGGSLWLRKVG